VSDGSVTTANCLQTITFYLLPYLLFLIFCIQSTVNATTKKQDRLASTGTIKKKKMPLLMYDGSVSMELFHKIITQLADVNLKRLSHFTLSLYFNTRFYFLNNLRKKVFISSTFADDQKRPLVLTVSTI
jgi:hypothetical protein